MKTLQDLQEQLTLITNALELINISLDKLEHRQLQLARSFRRFHDLYRAVELPYGKSDRQK